MWKSTTRAVRMGLLVLPDEQLGVPARIDGIVLSFNPDARGLEKHINALLDALPANHPCCPALVALVEANRRTCESLATWPFSIEKAA